MLFVIESGHRPLSIFICKGISASHFFVAAPCSLVTYAKYAPCGILVHGNARISAVLRQNRISVLRLRVPWSRTPSTFPAEYSHMGMLVSLLIYGV